MSTIVAMLAESVLITGANRGIGLELVRQLSPTSKNVFAVCRNPKEAKDLQSLAGQNASIKILELKDVKDYSSYNVLVSQVEDVVGQNGLNLLINNAGMSPKGQALAQTNAEMMMDTYEVNAVAPLMLTKAFLSLLERAAKSKESLPISCARAAVINVTSQMGSIADNQMGSFYAYRGSKAALNIITKSLSVDLAPSNILVTCLHPGWVQTDMGSERAPMKTDESVSRIIKTLHKLGKNENGAFVNYDNKVLPW